MKLYFFRGEQPNFGDELNLDLMPKVFPDFFDEDGRDLFLAIGSVLFDHHPADARKIVFGSGYAGYTKPPVLDDKWRVYCVRGPETARRLGLPPDKVAADTAILLNRYRPRRTTAGSHVSFIPHWQSIPRGNWEAVCREAGIHFIDPRAPVETVLSELENSTVVLAEAMHGAIVSDALRVPWVPLQPLSSDHRVKWHDWAAALDMVLPTHGLSPSTLWEAAVATLEKPCRSLGRTSGVIGACRRVADPVFTRSAVRRLQELARIEPMLSSDAAMDRALDKLETAAGQIRRDFHTGAATR